MINNKAPDALMFLGSRCPYCPAVLEGLTHLLKSGEIGRLEVINIEASPEAASELGIRSVPWVRIGPFELEGQQTPGELKAWAERASGNEGVKEYIAELLNTGGIAKAETLIKANPDYFRHLLDIFTDEDTSLNIRVGVGALMEMLADDQVMHDHIEDLGQLTQHENPLVRTDACHYLSLTELESTRKYIEPLLEDADEDVREVAKESLQALGM
ncbi:MAG: thioredoxin family protein [Gammaproteobacteria bacterium]|nr:thioredoxin family protein [Gammaproteobacteria bacterium]